MLSAPARVKLIGWLIHCDNCPPVWLQGVCPAEGLQSKPLAPTSSFSMRLIGNTCNQICRVCRHHRAQRLAYKMGVQWQEAMKLAHLMRSLKYGLRNGAGNPAETLTSLRCK